MPDGLERAGELDKEARKAERMFFARRGAARIGAALDRADVSLGAVPGGRDDDETDDWDGEALDGWDRIHLLCSCRHACRKQAALLARVGEREQCFRVLVRALAYFRDEAARHYEIGRAPNIPLSLTDVLEDTFVRVLLQEDGGTELLGAVQWSAKRLVAQRGSGSADVVAVGREIDRALVAISPLHRDAPYEMVLRATAETLVEYREKYHEAASR